MQKEPPLISCICITAYRPRYLSRSITNFHNQSYQRKEMVISMPYDDVETQSIIRAFQQATDINLKIIARTGKETIGEARNMAVQAADGEYVCMWDDDDLYSLLRLEEQYYSLGHSERSFNGVVYSRILLYHIFELKTYISFPSYWACTLFCSKRRFLQLKCDNQNQFELDQLIAKLVSTNEIIAVDSPTSYVFIYHGENALKYKTFLQLVNLSYAASAEINSHITSNLGHNNMAMKD